MRQHQETIFSIQVVDVGKAFIEALGALINVKFIRCFLLLQQISFSSIEITFKQYEPIELIFKKRGLVDSIVDRLMAAPRGGRSTTEGELKVC